MGVIYFNNVYIAKAASVVGKLENEGPLGEYFDLFETDPYFSKDSWEQAESEMVQRVINLLLSKSKLKAKDIGLMLGGDLLNQCTATAFAAQSLPIPYLGLYGACSTIAEGIIIGGMFIESFKVNNAVAVASSHFCSSERQFRFPLEYGSLRTPVSQNTVTGAGAFLLQNTPAEVKLSSAVIGKVKENGITDANNMGAAMANAAVDTILRFFDETKENPCDYDIISTGDLGREGSEIAAELFAKCGLDLCGRLTDCGMLIYDYEKQDVNSGGSGCGCLACVSASLYFDKLLRREVKKILLIGTGALLSPKTVLQKLPIPSVAHLIGLERV